MIKPIDKTGFISSLFDIVVKNSKLTREELIKDQHENNTGTGHYCIKCMVGDHENCKLKSNKQFKCDCKKCRIAIKWK